MSVRYCARIAVWFITKKGFSGGNISGLHIKFAEYLICVDFGRKALVYGIRQGNLIQTSKLRRQIGQVTTRLSQDQGCFHQLCHVMRV